MEKPGKVVLLLLTEKLHEKPQKSCLWSLPLLSCLGLFSHFMQQVKIIAENGELKVLPWTWEVLVHEVGASIVL